MMGISGSAEVRWAGRIPRHKMIRLYELDAQGLADEELIDDVAWGCYARCLAILQATRAYAGVVACPACGAEITHAWRRGEVLLCAGCGWQMPLADYARSFLGKKLHGGSAMHVWQAYVERFPAAATPRDKMLLIDWLIHQLHSSTRSVAVQLIGGTPREVAALLDGLAYAEPSTPGLAENRRAWREQMASGAYAAQLPAQEDTALSGET